MTKKKIIYYHAQPPHYVLHPDAHRPAINWDTPGGSWVGIWGYDWGDLLGNSMLAYSSDFEFEVWQPDTRADKVYEHRFENGLLHKLFPARLQKQAGGSAVTSSEVLRQLEEEQRNGEIILQTGVKTRLDWLIRPNEHLKIMGTYHGTIQMPRQKIFKLRKNILTYFSLIREHYALKDLLPRYSLITYQNKTNLDNLKELYQGPIRKITMGIDFNTFRPLDSKQCRKALGLPTDKKILLTVGRLNFLKQNDQVVSVLNNLHKDQDFLLVVVGSADDKQYFDHLKKLAAPLTDSGKILFAGYKRGEELIEYYNAADLFLMSSTSEGCSVASMEAIACETPVFTTRTGYIAELLKHYGRGYVAGIRDYQEWEEVLGGFLSGKTEINSFDREIAREDFASRLSPGNSMLRIVNYWKMANKHIFLHLYKTGGQTLRNLFLYQTNQENYFDIGKNTLEDFLRLEDQDREKLTMVFGDVKYGMDRFFAAPGEVKYLSMLRDPVARIRSLHRYVNQNKSLDLHLLMPEEERLDLESFLTHIDQYSPYHGNNGMCKMIAGINKDFPKGNLWDEKISNEASGQELLSLAISNIESRFSVVGLLEYFDESIILYKKEVGWNKPLFYLQRNTSKKEKVKLDRGILEMIREKNELDLQLYEHVKTKFCGLLASEREYVDREMRKIRKYNKLYGAYRKVFRDLPKKIVSGKWL